MQKTTFLFIAQMGMIVLGLLWQCPATAQSLSLIRLNGYIQDAVDGEALPGATIAAANGRGVAANANGFYSILLPQGENRLQIRSIGYQSIGKTIALQRDTVVDFNLSPASLILQSVEVSSSPELLDTPGAGSKQIAVSAIQKMPALLGEADVLKSIQMLPGVNSTMEGNTGLYVRGGSADQTLILLDGVTVYNSAHALGFVSVFDAGALQAAGFYNGVIPARYGGRGSGVLDLQMKEGSKEKLKGQGALGLLSSRALLEGPLFNKKASFMATGRRTYLDIPLALTQASADTDISFYDLSFKTNWALSEKVKLFASFYKGKDRFKLATGRSGGVFDSRSAWGNTTVSLRLHHLISPKMAANATALYSFYGFGSHLGMAEASVSYQNGIEDWGAKYDVDFFINNAHSLQAGWQLLAHNIDMGGLAAEYMNGSGIPMTAAFDIPNRQSLENAIYVEDEIKINKQYAVTAGLRFSQYGLYAPEKKVYAMAEPRFSIIKNTLNGHSFALGWGRNAQYLQLLSSGIVNFPTDNYASSSPALPPLSVWFSGLSWRKKFRNRWGVSVEAYAKSFSGLMDFKDGAMLFKNENYESETRTGRGRAAGLEILLEKSRGKWMGWLSYTFSKSLRHIPGVNNGKEYNAGYDKPHSLKAFCAYEGARWAWGFNFVLESGRPLTVPLYSYDNGASIIWSERNAYRLPFYHRADTSITYKTGLKKGRGHSGITLSVYNLYNRRNVHSLYFEDDKAHAITLFPVLPSLSWAWSF